MPEDTNRLHALPLFPLQTVLFPGGSLDLQIFELRYLDMVRKCHRESRPFGVVCLSSGSEVRKASGPAEQFHAIGTLAVIEQLDTVQAGLLRVHCRGGQRFRLEGSQQQANGLWVANAALLPDDPPCAIPADLQRCATALAEYLAPDAGGSGSGSGNGKAFEDCGWVANRWCELLPLGSAPRQRLMSLDNPLLRLELVNDFLREPG